MINFKQGQIGDYKTGKMVDIVVKAKSPNKLKDILVGGSVTLIGIAYLAYTAFKNGAKAYERAEFNTLSELGLIESNKDGSVKVEPKEKSDP